MALLLREFPLWQEMMPKEAQQIIILSGNSLSLPKQDYPFFSKAK
jgi:hypothetical protein